MVKFVALAGAVLTGGTVAVNTQLETEVVDDNPVVENNQGPRGGHKRVSLDEVRENGIPYLQEKHLEELTEEQALQITSFIDQVNATYDFASMDDETLKETLETIKDEMKALYDELGVEKPEKVRPELPKKEHRGPSPEVIKESGLPHLDAEKAPALTEEQINEINSFIDEVNETYDFASMDDETLKETLDSIREEMHSLFDELGIEAPEKQRAGMNKGFGDRDKGGRGGQRPPKVDETTDESSEL